MFVGTDDQGVTQHAIYTTPTGELMPRLIVPPSAARPSATSEFSAPRWSVRGDIAFTLTGDIPPQIYITTASATPPHLLTPVSGYADDWSPDGKTLLFTHGRRLCKIGSDGKGLRCIARTDGRTNSPTPACWSPDGKTVLLVRHGSLMSVRADGSHPRKLLSVRRLGPPLLKRST